MQPHSRAGGVSRHFHSPGRLFPVQRIQTFRQVTLSMHRLDRGTWSWRAPEGAEQALTVLLLPLRGTISVTSRLPVADPMGSDSRSAAVLTTEHTATLWVGGGDSLWAAIWVPTDVLSGLGLSVESPLTPGDTRLLAATKAFVSATVRASGDARTRRSDPHTMERVLLGLVVTVLLENTTTVPGGASQIDQMERAHALILAHLRDPSFTSEKLASALSMSERSVQRLFARYGTTPSQVLRQFRAEIAASLMHNRQQSGMSAAQVARRAGFRSVSAMRRALRATASAPPSPAEAEAPEQCCSAGLPL